MTRPVSRRVHLSPHMGSPEEWKRTFQTWLSQANKGNINCTGTVTLDTSANTTTVNDPRAGPTSYIGFMPTSANAAVERSNIAVQSQAAGTFTIAHTNNSVADRSFVYCIIG